MIGRMVFMRLSAEAIAPNWASIRSASAQAQHYEPCELLFGGGETKLAVDLQLLQKSALQRPKDILRIATPSREKDDHGERHPAVFQRDEGLIERGCVGHVGGPIIVDVVGQRTTRRRLELRQGGKCGALLLGWALVRFPGRSKGGRRAPAARLLNVTIVL